MRGLIAGLLLCLACTPNTGSPGAPGEVVATRDVAWVNAFASTAPGDTLRYTISWSPGARAQGYAITTTVTQGTGWTNLLPNAQTVGTSVAFTPIHLAAWDSASFRACVASTAPGKANSAARCVDWTVVRGPGVPGDPVVDSSLVIAQIILKPDAATLSTLGTQQFCPYARMLDGGVRFLSGYEDLSLCQGYYDAMPDRLPGYPVAMGRQTEWFEVIAGWRVQVRTPQDELARLLFAGPFTLEAVWSS